MTTSSYHNEQPRSNRNQVVATLNPRSLFTATAVISGVFFTACVLALAVAPQATMAFFNYILHADLTNIARPVTPSNFIAGFLAWSLGTGLYAALVAWIYNRLAL